MQKLKEKLEEIQNEQNQIKDLVFKNEKNIFNNNMSEYMKNEKTIFIKLNILKIKEKEMIENLEGKKITEKINESEVSDTEKQNLLKIQKEVEGNYKEINETLKKINLYIEAKMDLGALIAEAITEEDDKIKKTVGKLYDKKI